jgi:hypothetical protein
VKQHVSHCFIFMSMNEQTPNQPVERKRNRYRLVIMNDDTFEEVTQFRLSRITVYVALSTAFVSMVALTVSLIVFTPIKYYLPGAGYGNMKQIRELKNLSLKTDSLQKSLERQQQINEIILKVLRGEVRNPDTTMIGEDAEHITLPAKKEKRDKKRKKRK